MAHAIFNSYGVNWPTGSSQEYVELRMIREWGYTTVGGKKYGQGMEYHLNAFYKLTWPNDATHKWTELINRELATMEVLCAITGPASSGKTYSAAKFLLAMFWANPDRCTILCSTTTKTALDLRIFGEIKKLWRSARQRNPALIGNLMESRQMIVTDAKYAVDGRDFRNGILGIACKKGEKEVNLANYIGIKNEIVILVGDELQMMNKHYLSALSNLRKNPKFMFLAMGNPLDQSDALGQITEPEDGYDTYPYELKTAVYKTKYSGGKVVRLCGLDSPNLDTPAGQTEPYPFIIGREDIEADARYYGTESLQYYSMSLGVLSRMGSARRIITRQVCELNRAYDQPVFGSVPIKKLAALDAAYSGEGGDRCVLTIGGFGPDTEGKNILALLEPPILVPINPTTKDISAEDQISIFCRDTCKVHGIDDSDFFYDSTGRGSLGPSLARHWGTGINPVEFGGQATERPLPNSKTQDPNKVNKTCREEFHYFVSELWWFSRFLIEAGQAKGLTQDMVDEASQREYMIVGNKKIQVEPKDKMKERTGRSPDLWDSFCTLIEGARRKGFEIRGTIRQSDKSDNAWLKKQQEKVQAMLKKTTLRAA